MDKNLTNDKLIELGFDHHQISEIIQGMESGIDFSVYLDKEYLPMQMREIRRGLLSGVDVNIYAGKEYDWFQMEEIRQGLENNVDVTKYLSVDITYDRMKEIRLGLEHDIDLTKYLKYSAGIIKEIRLSYKDDIDIIEFVEAGYDAEQLQEIRYALKNKYDIKPYITEYIRAVCIREIIQGIEAKVDVSIYAKDCYNWKQMKEIRIGLANRMDVSKYIDPLYDWKQMRELRYGLEAGLDVSAFSSFAYSFSEMKRRRELLMNPEKIDLKGRKTNNAFKIVLENMNTEAYIVLGEAKVTEKEIKDALREMGITYGIISNNIMVAASGAVTDEMILIAKGESPTHGKDGWYEFYVNIDPLKSPEYLEDGSAEFSNIMWYENVVRDQKIAYYHSAERGNRGVDVKGNVIEGLYGREKELLKGNGFRLLDNGKTYISEMDGSITYTNGTIEIIPLLVLEKANRVIGDVEFDGNIWIKGNVSSGCDVKATGDVFVEGYVEKAKIYAGGSIVIKLGTNGALDLYAKKNVVSKFFESSTVRSDNIIQAGYTLNSNLQAEVKVEIVGTKGFAIGGTIKANYVIDVYNAGNENKIHTVLKCDLIDKFRYEILEIDKRLKGVEEELSLLNNSKRELLEKVDEETLKTLPLFIKLENAIYTKNMQKRDIIDEKEAKKEEQKQVDNIKVIIRGKAYSGTEVVIGNSVWEANGMKNIQVVKQGKGIRVKEYK